MRITHMKRIIPLMAIMLLAGCRNNSTENQSGSVSPPAGEQPSNSAETSLAGTNGASNNSPSIETTTNNSATNSNAMDTNAPAGTNQNSGN